MDTRNCCSGCLGVDNVFSCSSPIRRVPSHTHLVNTVKKEETVIQGEKAVIAAMPKASVAVKKEEIVKVEVNA
ncbi:hypothetical protein SASPL_112391 [Salvia splendens]|uniref:Uncharacterized protein n=1 Tax=Salvia splendens TaxID=180675 RepID=A0A8X9A464_SALSN|nr:hypothetical protein SASPL_112391 [Salvia splendens]